MKNKNHTEIYKQIARDEIAIIQSVFPPNSKPYYILAFYKLRDNTTDEFLFTGEIHTDISRVTLAGFLPSFYGFSHWRDKDILRDYKTPKVCILIPPEDFKRF